MALFRHSISRGKLAVLYKSRLISNYKRSDKILLKSGNYAFAEITAGKEITESHWQKIRKDALFNSRMINEVNVDSIILGNCLSVASLSLGKSYINFLKNDGKKINYATWGKLLKLYHAAGTKSPLNSTDIEDINGIYNKMIKTTPILDAQTCESLILALSLTENWKECIALIEMIKITCTPSTSAFCNTISAAFNNGDGETGWKYCNELISVHRADHIDDIIYTSWLKYCTEMDKDWLNGIEKLLDFTKENEVILSRKVAEELERIFHTKNYKTKFASVNSKYQCSACETNLQSIAVTPEEFQDLCDTFLQSVLIRKDVFVKTNPIELENFTKFLNKTLPYDCVIDGLNIAFSRGNNKSPKVYAQLISSVAKYFVDQNKKVLVLGRKHMNKWPQESMKYIRNNCNVFLTENISHDDPYLLYATLKSGSHTKFVSKDLMRSHSFLLEKKIKSVFSKWQRINQYLFIRATERGHVLFEEPNFLDLNAQKCNEHWHIPFREPSDGDHNVNKYSWLCINK